MSIKKKISNTVYQVYVDKYPDTVKLKIYKGDFFSFTVLGFNFDGAPFDFSLYDSFSSQIRIGSPLNKYILYTFDVGEIILGKSDINKSEFNEIHVVSKDLGFDIPYPMLWMDIQGKINNEETKTFIKINISVEADITI